MDKNTFKIDNITWNDLGLSDIYEKLNRCKTSAGEDYLHTRLENPFICDCDEFSEFKILTDEVNTLSKEGKAICESFLENIGKLNKYSFKETVSEYKEAIPESNLKHILIGLFVVLFFALIFVWPGPAMVLFFCAIAYSVSDYFKNKNIISKKLVAFSYLIRMLKSIRIILKNQNSFDYYNVSGEGEETDSALRNRIQQLSDIYSTFKPFMRGTYLISEGARTNSNPFSIALDYIRMIFHVDIIKYNSMIAFLKEHINEAYLLYDIVGEFDCILSLEKAFEQFELCKPEILDDYNCINIIDGYHPLLENPVKNTLQTSKNVLITGCNASGKSTFLRMTAICAIFAQSFNVTFAKEYKAPYFCILSSMSLKDDINSNESYFMSEIKSLKRIVDTGKSIKDSKCRMLCVIDEVLRGTNTVERIAASVEILKSLSTEGIMCITATHDIELTELLASEYDNYHFTEEISNDDVSFSYIINKGPATSRNAIRLLSVLGYDEQLVRLAESRADRFVSDGVWC